MDDSETESDNNYEDSSTSDNDNSSIGNLYGSYLLKINM